MVNFEELSNNVIKGNQGKVEELTQKAVDEGVDHNRIIDEGLINGMDVVGKRFKAGDMFVPEVLMSAKAMKAGMNIVQPLLVEDRREEAGSVVLGTVAGDLHDIGKNLVGMLLESGGLKVTDLGTDVEAQEFVKCLKEIEPDVLGMSALLTTTMLEMKDVLEVLQEEGLRDEVKVIVGGAPVTKEFADEIGADGWAPDAASAKDLVLELIEE